MSGPYEDLFLENGNINESPILFYIGGDTPCVFMNFPYPFALVVLPGGEVRSQTHHRSVCAAPPPPPSGLRNLILVFLLFWGLVGWGNPIGNLIKAI